MLNSINDLLKISVVSGIVSSIAIFIYQSLFKHWLSKDLEKYKNTLNEEFKRNEIKFSKLHNDRAEILRELYSKLVDLIINAKDLIDVCNECIQIYSIEQKKERINAYYILYKDFINFTDKNRIFFNKNICSLINKIKKSLLVRFSENVDIDLGFELKEEYQTNLQYQYWAETLNDIIDLDLSKLKNVLEDEFRVLLGIEC